MTTLAPEASRGSRSDFATTSGVLALSNLQAQIEGLQAHVQAGVCSVEEQAGLIDLVALRGMILGQITEYQWAEKQAEHLACEFPTESVAFLARARARATFHRFAEALTDLNEAECLGAIRETVDGERASVFQALGQYDQALALLGAAVDRRPDFTSLGALATLHAEMGETARAQQLFAKTRSSHCGVSPIPLALLDFQQGHMWMGKGELNRCRIWFESAVGRLPAYAPAQGHLAEVEAEVGETETAIQRLGPLTTSSDDPDYSAALSRVLRQVGQREEADRWRSQAAARYDELISLHPEAFADHAAEFWLEVGGDPDRARWLAERNLQVRQTPRAHELLTRATLAGDGARAIHPARDGDGA